MRSLDLANLSLATWLKLGIGAAAGVAIALAIMRYAHKNNLHDR
jgi:uncharacterized membrane-anchored protein YhcB (DUF1043 family)